MYGYAYDHRPRVLPTRCLHNILLFSILTTVIRIILRFNTEAIVIGNRNYTTRTFRLQMIFCNLN